MALTGPLEFDGVLYPNAYAKTMFNTIDSVLGSPFVNFYKTKADREEDLGNPLTQKQYSAAASEFDNGVVMAKTYEYLKSLPEFAGWVDA